MAYLMTFTLLVVVLLHSTSAQISIRETLFRNTTCDLNSVSIDCGSSNVIALQQVQYGYNPKCNNTCCQYNASDCLVTVQDLSTIKRECSGRSSCNATLANSTREFCTNGTQVASYIYTEYYCIQKSRTVSVCSNKTINSTGLPLYLTNEGYPGETVGDNSCSCSFEAKSCSSGVTSYIMDADMYNDPANCLQSLLITDAGGVLQESVKCESYNSTFVTQKNLSSNYYQMYFDNNSTQNQTGYFFIGFQASEHGVPFSVSCSKKSASWCIDCGLPHNITNGLIMLDIQNKSMYNATASVTCNPGFYAVNKTIVCQEQGIWNSAECIIKDCGVPNDITNGMFTLNELNQTVYNSTATVTCNTGFKANSTAILCTEQGIWESASCILIDCDVPNGITNGMFTLNELNQTVYNSTATVTCNTGFKANTTAILCTEQGIWERASCIFIDCGVPNDITNGMFTLNELNQTVYNSTATVTCNTGFNANTTAILCTEQGWESASCIPRDCGHPWISEGSLTLEDPNNTTIGATATVTCNYGYKSDVFYISCLATGLWEAASCTIFDCGPLPTISAGELTLLDPPLTTFGSRANVTCYSGFQSETTTISCLPSAWEPASCTAIKCGPVVNISFGVIRPTDRANLSYGAEAVVECGEEYSVTKSMIQCLASGTWENSSCIKNAITQDQTVTITVVVIFVGVPALIQLGVAVFLHITIYKHNTSSTGKAVGYILLCAIPYIGVIFIVRFYAWKGYNRDNIRYYVNDPKTLYSSDVHDDQDDHDGNTFSNPGYEVVYNPARSTITINANNQRNSKKDDDEVKTKEPVENDTDTATHLNGITQNIKESAAILTVTQN